MEFAPLLFALTLMAAFAVGTGRIAERKGYSFFVFAIVGLFLGLVGVLVALVLPRRTPAY